MLSPRLLVRIAAVAAALLAGCSGLLLLVTWGIGALSTAVLLLLSVVCAVYLGELSRRTPE